MPDHTYAIIMAGGKGERFWPLSTRSTPKQLLSIVSDKPMLAMTLDYLDGLIPPERTFVITNADLVTATREAVPQVPADQIVGEPVGRDTAAACALGCALVRARDPHGVFCVLTADHVIHDIDIFQQTLADSLALAQREPVLVTLGIRPAWASTGFGYIEAGARMTTGSETNYYRARRFVEKPDEKTAREYLEAGSYFWNSGMFIWSAETFRNALGQHQPPLAELADAMQAVAGTDAFDESLRRRYAELGKISVDYAIMEKAENIVMAEGVFRWDDVGTWTALRNHFAADADGNVVVGNMQAISASNNIVYSHERLTALIGIEGVVVVQAAGATLVCAEDQVQNIKALVGKLKEGPYDELL